MEENQIKKAKLLNNYIPKYNRELMIRQFEFEFLINYNEDESFLTFNFNIDGRQDAIFIFISLFLKKVFIRKCYKELYPLIFDSQNTGNHHFSFISGTPGIGKSVFLSYILSQYIKNPNTKQKPFAISYSRNSYFVFNYISDNKYIVSDYDDNIRYEKDFYRINNSLHLIIYDYCSNQYIENDIPAYNKIVLSSNKTNYFVYSLRYYMPIWTENELLKLEPDRFKWKFGYELYGGVPRYILHILSIKKISKDFFDSNMIDNLHSILFRNIYLIKKNWFIYSTAYSTNNDMNELLVHRFPIQLEDGTIPDYKEVSIDFASYYVRYFIIKFGFIDFEEKNIKWPNNNQETFTEFTQFKNLVTYEYFFEDNFLFFNPPISNSNIEVYQLFPKHHIQSPLKINFNFPKETKSFNPDEQIEFNSNAFYIPIKKNSQSIDSFFFENNTLYCIKITTRILCIDYTNLITVKNYFHNNNIEKINLIFVVPDNLVLINTQKILNIPEDEEVNQYLWIYP